MTDRTLSDIEDEENWDYDEAVVHAASKTARGVVPVAFAPEEFERIASYARSRGETLSQCVHSIVVRHLEEMHTPADADTTDTAHDPLD